MEGISIREINRSIERVDYGSIFNGMNAQDLRNNSQSLGISAGQSELDAIRREMLEAEKELKEQQ